MGQLFKMLLAKMDGMENEMKTNAKGMNNKMDTNAQQMENKKDGMNNEIKKKWMQICKHCGVRCSE